MHLATQNLRAAVFTAALFLSACSVTPDPAGPVVNGPVCDFDGITFDGNFEGGRLSSCQQIADTSFRLTIRPETRPINPSAWYAFNVTADAPRSIAITLDYEDFRHRYPPKIRVGSDDWQVFDGPVRIAEDQTEATFSVALDERITTIAAQPIIVPRDTLDLVTTLAESPFAPLVERAGNSRQGRPILALTTTSPSGNFLLVLGRQHPPETTGAVALEAFLDRLFEKDDLSTAFHALMGTSIYPMLNPDGVAAGHWRTDSTLVDMNRDWGPFALTETALVRDKLNTRIGSGQRLMLGLDFHSTNKDVLYTQPDGTDLPYGRFAHDWHAAINAALGGTRVVERDDGHNAAMPTFKTWVHVTYGVPGITVELGDNTPREDARRIGRVAAESLMKWVIGNTPEI